MLRPYHVEYGAEFQIKMFDLILNKNDFFLWFLLNIVYD